MKRYGWIMVLAAAWMAVSACGSTEGKKETVAAGDTATAEEACYETEDMAAPSEGPAENGQIQGTSAGGEETGQKLIRTVELSMETKEFDDLLTVIQTKMEEFGGYVEASNISGDSYQTAGRKRYASLTLRIPAERLKEFLTAAGEMGNITDQSERVQDITLEYADTESHKKALETEQQRLLELMEKAESMEDIIAIESRLSQIRYELQSYESSLRVYDNQVDYSTVSVYINEVERESPVENQGFFGEIKAKFSENIYRIGRGLRAAAVWLISSLPYLLLAVVILVPAFLVLKKAGRRKKKEKGKDGNAM